MIFERFGHKFPEGAGELIVGVEGDHAELSVILDHQVLENVELSWVDLSNLKNAVDHAVATLAQNAWQGEVDAVLDAPPEPIMAADGPMSSVGGELAIAPAPETPPDDAATIVPAAEIAPPVAPEPTERSYRRGR